MNKDSWLANRQHEMEKGATDKGIAITSSGLRVSVNNKSVIDNTTVTGYVYLLIDCSGSMRKYGKIEQAKKRSIDFAIEAQARGYFVGLIKFDSHALLLCKPQRENRMLQEQLKTLVAGDRTNMGEGIRVATENLMNLRGSLYMVIVTDGRQIQSKMH